MKLEIGHINPVSFIPFTAGYLFQLYKKSPAPSVNILPSPTTNPVRTYLDLSPPTWLLSLCPMTLTWPRAILKGVAFTMCCLRIPLHLVR